MNWEAFCSARFLLYPSWLPKWLQKLKSRAEIKQLSDQPLKSTKPCSPEMRTFIQGKFGFLCHLFSVFEFAMRYTKKAIALYVALLLAVFLNGKESLHLPHTTKLTLQGWVNWISATVLCSLLTEGGKNRCKIQLVERKQQRHGQKHRPTWRAAQKLNS